jgi:tetratricopeptide (TPR) repeat protein
VLAKEADSRRELAELDLRMDLYSAAVQQYTLWLSAHQGDISEADALNGRCWARALANQDLALALGDCNAALREVSRSPSMRAQVLDSRGLVYLRMANYAASVQDYGAALAIDPKQADSLYGHGISELRLGHADQGQTDLKAAAALKPRVSDTFRAAGIDP